MADFKFLSSSNWPSVSKKWVISAPRRAKRPARHASQLAGVAGRPDVAHGTEPVCPFCPPRLALGEAGPGRENEEKEVYRVPKVSKDFKVSKVSNGGSDGAPFDTSDTFGTFDTSWLVRVLNNKFPFAPIHEIVIHSPDHHKNFDELPLAHTELILKTYRHRYLEHAHKGNVFIFHNRGEKGGESLPHPHSQIAVVPFEIELDTPRLTPVILDTLETKYFSIFCPPTSQWPDEVWIAPITAGRNFGEIQDSEIADLAFVLSRLIEIFDARHGSEFPFNFYIYPGGNWYLRLIPRLKTIGGFELSSGIFVNTQDPKETLAFIKEHFESPNREKIKNQHQANYHKHA